MLRCTFKRQNYVCRIRANNLKNAVRAFFRTNSQIDFVTFEVEDGPKGIAYRRPGGLQSQNTNKNRGAGVFEGQKVFLEVIMKTEIIESIGGINVPVYYDNEYFSYSFMAFNSGKYGSQLLEERLECFSKGTNKQNLLSLYSCLLFPI